MDPNVNTELIAHAHQLKQMLRLYNPGKADLAALRAMYKTDQAITTELKSMRVIAQRSALSQIENLRPTIH